MRLSFAPLKSIAVFFFFQPPSQHMKVPSPGIESKLWLWPTHLWQCWILNLLCHSGNSTHGSFIEMIYQKVFRVLELPCSWTYFFWEFSCTKDNGLWLFLAILLSIREKWTVLMKHGMRTIISSHYYFETSHWFPKLPFFFFFFFFFFFLVFLGPNPQHNEGSQARGLIRAYDTATATPDLIRICDLQLTVTLDS